MRFQLYRGLAPELLPDSKEEKRSRKIARCEISGALWKAEDSNSCLTVKNPSGSGSSRFDALEVFAILEFS